MIFICNIRPALIFGSRRPGCGAWPGQEQQTPGAFDDADHPGVEHGQGNARVGEIRDGLGDVRKLAPPGDEESVAIDHPHQQQHRRERQRPGPAGHKPAGGTGPVR